MLIEKNCSLTESEIENNKWHCNKCMISNLAKIFPFGLENDYGLLNILNADSLKFLENLPTYDITSKAFVTLKPYDIDHNTISNINSRYYPASEFQSMHRNNSFNILHTNLNWLENKFEHLHNFINSADMNLDIIGISETSQRENSGFSMNVSIEGYHHPFTIGSKTNQRWCCSLC